MTDVPYVRIETAPKTVITDAEVRSLGLIPVFRRADTILAAYATDPRLRKLDGRLDLYEDDRQKLGVLSKIESLQPWSREDRTSSRLKERAIDPGAEYTVDVLLLPIEGHPANPQAISAIERFVGKRHGSVVDRALNPKFTALRVRLGGQALDDLLEYRDDVALVDLPPAAHVLVPATLSLDLDDVQEPTAPPKTAPVICVVDSGILEDHPLLGPAILREKSRSFPPELGPPVPTPPVTAAGHGTQVAGIALYGDVGASAMKKEFAADVWLANARILDDKNELHPNRMPFLRDIVKHVKDRCRILNLSLGLEPCEGFLSVHAAELDELTREIGVLFVVAAGNENFGRSLPEKPYPAFLVDPAWLVRSPGEALNVLTVGGMTTDREPYPHPHRKPIAPKRAPSPFSRTGALKNVINPELIEVAGNVAYDSGTGQCIWNDPGLGVPSTSDRLSEGNLLGTFLGTSLSTPKVAYLAARILDRYGDATPNLLRALLVQSAHPPEGFKDQDPKLIMRLCGFGVPDLDRALYCRPARASLFYEGEISMDEVQIFELPVPTDFAKSKGRKTISVTIAYDPPVSVVHRDRPAGIDLSWGIARGDVPAATLQAAITAEAEQEAAMATETAPSVAAKRSTKARKSPFMTGEFPKRMQRRGTVQKNVFAWQRGVYDDPYRIAITAKAIRPSHAKDSQRFAIAATLECEDASVNVYSLVRSRLGAGRVRIRAPS